MFPACNSVQQDRMSYAIDCILYSRDDGLKSQNLGDRRGGTVFQGNRSRKNHSALKLATEGGKGIVAKTIKLRNTSSTGVDGASRGNAKVFHCHIRGFLLVSFLSSCLSFRSSINHHTSHSLPSNPHLRLLSLSIHTFLLSSHIPHFNHKTVVSSQNQSTLIRSTCVLQLSSQSLCLLPPPWHR